MAEEGNRLAASKTKAAAPNNNMVPFSSRIFVCLFTETTLFYHTAHPAVLFSAERKIISADLPL
jgi:hypothetical protein